MDKVKYVKGNREEVVKRFSQIHTINLRCPISDSGVRCLRASMISSLNCYANEEGTFNNVPVIDSFNAFMYTLTFCRENEIPVDTLYIVWGCVQSFKCLKYVSFEFIDDDELVEAYSKINKVDCSDADKINILKKIYDVRVLEFNLTSMFYQNVIDIFNKCMMHNGLMNNSYLKREFYINFDYDGYTSFMDMFLTNNGIMFEGMDKNIIEYFRMFPVFIADQKPMIRIVTNYSDI